MSKHYVLDLAELFIVTTKTGLETKEFILGRYGFHSFTKKSRKKSRKLMNRFKDFMFLALPNPVLYLSYITSTNQFSSQFAANFVLIENNHNQTFFTVVASPDYCL